MFGYTATTVTIVRASLCQECSTSVEQVQLNTWRNSVQEEYTHLGSACTISPETKAATATILAKVPLSV